MKRMYIGSGDVSSLMSGKDTEAFKKLLRKFVSDEKPHYNAKASPIDALRIGAILEDRYFNVLPDGYYAQYVVQSSVMNIFKASLDFALIDKGEVVDFDELKSLSFNDFLELEKYRGSSEKEYLPYIKTRFKKYYNQLQEQLYCSGLKSANLVFLAVYSYEDDENYHRDIKENEFIKFRIKRDNKAIEAIKERGQIFQLIKDYYHDND